MNDTPANHWNWQERDDGLYFCRGDHHRAHDCDWEKLTIPIIKQLFILLREPTPQSSPNDPPKVRIIP